MIKGVNKQIVEINYTKNDYIEKAILIINPSKSSLPKEVISQKADDYMKTIMNKKNDPDRVLPHLPQHMKPKKQTISKPIGILSFLLILTLILLIITMAGA